MVVVVQYSYTSRVAYTGADMAQHQTTWSNFGDTHLPIVVRRKLVSVQPNSAGGGLAHFLALGRCD